MRQAAFIAFVTLIGILIVATAYRFDPSDFQFAHTQNQRAQAVIRPAQGVGVQDYRAEIIRHVIDPCFMAGIESDPALAAYGLDNDSSKAGMLEIAKFMDADGIEDVMAATLPAVEGLPFAGRKAIYDFGLSNCLRGVMEGR